MEEPNESSFPSREEFISNERSNAIRDACLLICKKAIDLIKNPDAQEARTRVTIYSELEQLNGKLIGLGIKSGMHVGSRPDAFNNPVIMAEYVAGQLVGLTGCNVSSEDEAMANIKEWSIDKIGEAYVLDEIPSRMQNFLQNRITVDLALRFLDAGKDTAM